MDRMVFCVLIVRAGGGEGLLFLQERNCGVGRSVVAV